MKKTTKVPSNATIGFGGANNIASYPFWLNSEVDEFLRYHKIIGKVPEGVSV